MYSCFIKYIFLLYRFFRKTGRYALLLGMAAVMVSSCGGSKQSSKMRQMEKHSKKNPVDENGFPVDTRVSGSKKARQAVAKQQKQEAAAAREAEKAYRDGLTRHRALQTQETRTRMDQNLKNSNKKYSNQKEFFLVRWFRPKDENEKIEKRQAKEDQKRMAATRRQADKNNKELHIMSATKNKIQKKPLPDPNDMPQGGGGVYKGGSAAKSSNPSDVQHGGGGSYTGGKSADKVKKSDYQQGGGGAYQTGKGKKASDYQQGGGGNMPGKSKKTKTRSKK